MDPSQLDRHLAALVDGRSPAAVAATALAISREVLGGTAVAFGAATGHAPVLGVDGVPAGLARATLRRGGIVGLVRAAGPQVVTPVREHAVLGPLGRHAEVAVVAALGAGGRADGVVVALLAAPPTEADLSTWQRHMAVAGLSLSGAVARHRAATVEARLDSLVAAVPQPVVVVDAEGRLEAVNPAAAEVFGLNPAFDRGALAASRLGSEPLAALLASSGGGVADIQLDGTEPRVLHARVVPLRRQDGAPAGRVLTLDDVTAREEAERVTADLVAVIGHELRTPLTMIRGYAATLARRGDDLRPEARTRAVEALHGQSDRLHQLIEDLLLVAGVERGRPELHLQEADVGVVVRRAVEHARRHSAAHLLEIEVPATPVVMSLDEVKVDQILHHLLDNACKFSDDGTSVTVAVVPGSDGGCRIEVRDRGIGIYSGDQPGLFDRFRQVDGSSTRRKGGTGVGLYICRRLVEAHGGRIGVRSALGHGSTFWIHLPGRPPGGASDAGDHAPA